MAVLSPMQNMNNGAILLMLQKIETQAGSQQPCRGGFPIFTLKIGKVWGKFKIDKEAQVDSDVWANSDGLQKYCTPPKDCLLAQKREKDAEANSEPNQASRIESRANIAKSSV